MNPLRHQSYKNEKTETKKTMVGLVNWQYLWAHKKWWVVLRYYATFKVRKFESLFYKIHVSKTRLQKTTTCLGLRVEQIFSLSIQYIYIYSFLGMAFAVLFRCYFQKVQVLVINKFWETFCYIVLLFLWAQKACLRF